MMRLAKLFGVGAPGSNELDRHSLVSWNFEFCAWIGPVLCESDFDADSHCAGAVDGSLTPNFSFQNMLEQFRNLLRSKYVRTLEEEVSRLRAENRALMNSLLGTAGFPPVEFPEAPKPQPLPRLRKRSWHQMQAWRETGAARDAAQNFSGREEARPNGPVPHS